MQHVTGVRAFGLLQNDPQRGPVALRTLDAVFGLPEGADGAGVATIVDGAALLSRTKLVASSPTSRAPSWATIVGAPRGRATIVQVGVATELRPSGGDPALHLGPFRARGYAAAVVGGPQSPDVAAASRERLLRELPDFLRRCVVGNSEGEAVFLAVLARVYARGLLDAAHDNAGALLDAIAAVLDDVDGAVDDAAGQAQRHVTLTNGVEVLHVARGVRSAVATLTGLADDVAAGIDPTLADSSTARERNRRYRAVVVLAGLDGPCAGEAPSGCVVESVDGAPAIVVGRDLIVRRA
jgi:hypothetical protein